MRGREFKRGSSKLRGKRGFVGRSEWGGEMLREIYGSKFVSKETIKANISPTWYD